jgi:hypothetical protein
MARTVNEIYNNITGWFVSFEPILQAYGLDESKSFSEQFSPVSLEAIIFYRVAYAVHFLETLFDRHKTEISDTIARMKPHTARWYATKAKLFQYGFNLLPDSDLYDNAGKTDEEITASRIVSYSAVVEVENKLLVKVAKDAGDLSPLTVDEKTAFTEYLSRIKDAGVMVDIISEPADNLRLSIDIYYNPLVLNDKGQRLDGTSTAPVAEAIHQYLKELPFNGELVLAYLTDALQRVDGVVIPHLNAARYQYGALNYDIVNVKYQPYAGYMRVTADNLSINYKPQSVIF